MMATYIAAVDAVTGEYYYGGWRHDDAPKPYDVEPGLSPGQVRVVADRVPDGRTEKWSGMTWIAKSAQEIAAWDAARKDAVAAQLDTNLAVQALAQLDFEERQKLVVTSGKTLLTAQQCKARIRAIYRSLLP